MCFVKMWPCIKNILKDFLSVNFGWAIGLALGVWVSGGISGGHINPAVSLFNFFHRIILSNFSVDYSGNGDLARFPLEKGAWYV